MSERASLAILASGDIHSGGGGSTMEAIVRATLPDGPINADVKFVISNYSRDEVPGLYKRVDDLNDEFELGIETRHIDQFRYPKGAQQRGQTLQESREIYEVTEDCTAVCMAGYLRIVTGALMEARGWKYAFTLADPEHHGIYYSSLTNNHPGILIPGDEGKERDTRDTHGIGTHKRAIGLALRGLITESAVTVQVAAERVDEGPIIEAFPVPITDEMLAVGRQDLDKAAEMLRTEVGKVEPVEMPAAIGRWLVRREEFLRTAA